MAEEGGHVLNRIAKAEHDNLPNKVRVKKTGNYFWDSGIEDWVRQGEAAKESTLLNVFKALKGLIDVDTTYTYNGDGTIATKVITDGAITATITYTWVGGELTSKQITMT